MSAAHFLALVLFGLAAHGAYHGTLALLWLDVLLRHRTRFGWKQFSRYGWTGTLMTQCVIWYVYCAVVAVIGILTWRGA